MAKKSKRPPARRHQRPQTRPATPSQGVSGVGSALVDAEQIEPNDYAAGALPIPDSDGPMPLPPPDEEEERDAADALAQAAARAAAQSPASAPPAPTPAAQQLQQLGQRRRVGRIDPSSGATRPGQRVKSGRQPSTASMFEPLPPDDAAIPFDRVPYVPGDLRRVLIIAAMMVVLVIVADVVISNVVK